MNQNNYKKPNSFFYYLGKLIAYLPYKILFKPKVIRNELKKEKKGCIVICNHECSLDFLYLYFASSRKCTFVLSKSFKESLPISKFFDKIRVISKQQFQTTFYDIKRMMAVVNEGKPLVIFPAGLMTENGVSTPIPETTYNFLKLLNVNVYVGRIRGSYFVNSKWSKKLKSGRTYFETYKLFNAGELKDLPQEVIKEKVDEAMLYDAYYEQSKDLSKYKNANNIEGLEKILYKCPHCHKEGTMVVENKSTIICKDCGFKATANKYGFLESDEPNFKYKNPAVWDKEIYDDLKNYVSNNKDYSISSKADLYMINEKKHKFEYISSGELSMDIDSYSYVENIDSNKIEKIRASNRFFILPNSSIRNSIEFQDGKKIYRFILKENNHFVAKWLHLLKIFYYINTGVDVKVNPKEI